MHKEPGTSGQPYIEAEFYQFENKSFCIRKYLVTSVTIHILYNRFFFYFTNPREVVYFCVMFSVCTFECMHLKVIKEI